MQVDYVGRGFDLTDGIRSFAANKLAKVEKFLEEPVEVKFTLGQEKHRNIAEVHIHHRFGVVQAADEAERMEEAIRLAIDKAEKQARRGRKKLVDKWRRSDRGNDDHHWPVEVLDATSITEGDEPRIIRTSQIEIKPMSIEEAALELESTHGQFVVFLDATSDLVSVLYRRKDNNYGLIAPEF